MSVFKTADHLYQCLGGALEQVRSEPRNQELLKSMNVVVRFVFTEPEASIMIVARRQEQAIICGVADRRADVEFLMSGDAAHRFFLGKLKVMEAIATRQIMQKGPIWKAMALSPLIDAVIAIYPDTFLRHRMIPSRRQDLSFASRRG
jgi:putative sterol carrier protein